MPSSAIHRNRNDLRYRDETHPSQAQLTPAYALEPIRAALGGIELDPCTEPDNPTRAARFYCPPVDGAKQPWAAQSVFCNPPYGKVRERWVKRCIVAGEAGVRVCLLMPAAMDTHISQSALASADVVLFVQGRLKFGVPRTDGRQMAASHPSALYFWNPKTLAPVGHLGRVCKRIEVVPTLWSAEGAGHG
jgi:hypothetical protein